MEEEVEPDSSPCMYEDSTHTDEETYVKDRSSANDNGPHIKSSLDPNGNSKSIQDTIKNEDTEVKEIHNGQVSRPTRESVMESDLCSHFDEVSTSVEETIVKYAANGPSAVIESPSCSHGNNIPTAPQCFTVREPGRDWELNILLLNISKELDNTHLQQIKFLLSGEDGIPKSDLCKFDTPLDLFTCLKETRMVSDDNTLLLQAVLLHADKKDLFEKVRCWAEELGESLYLYEPKKDEKVNGYKYIQFHVKGRSNDFMRSNLEALRAYVARLLAIKKEFVFVSGIEQSHSVVVTFLIPEQSADRLKNVFLSELSDGFINLGVDGIRFEIMDPLDLTGFLWNQSGEEPTTKEQPKNSVIPSIIKDDVIWIEDYLWNIHLSFKDHPGLLSMCSEKEIMRQKSMIPSIIRDDVYYAGEWIESKQSSIADFE